MDFLNNNYKDLPGIAQQNREAYLTAEPFPNIVFDNFFNEQVLNAVLAEFPDLAALKEANKYNSYNEKKLAGIGEKNFGDVTKSLAHFLNSEPFLNFLQTLTGIEEVLMPDPYFEGGGYHEIKPGGFLKVHADFNKHNSTGLDRRLNVLVYLNKDWQESFGGHFELWNTEMTEAKTKVLPVFNRMAIFSTTDFSYHGHPDPLTCPADRSRKSLALYYYTNGRPKNELSEIAHNTLFVGRKGIANDTTDPQFNTVTAKLKQTARQLTPPIIFDAVRSIFR